MKILLRPFAKKEGCCGSGSLVSVDAKPVDGKKMAAATTVSCCENAELCC